ncbi:MAG: VOC family protein [Mariniblastus sp.]
MSVKPIPENCNTVNAYLNMRDVQAAIDFYTAAFNANGNACLKGPGDSIMHAEVVIGNSTVMLSEENPKWGTKSAETMGGSPVSLHMYVPDVDTSFQQAIDAGCTVISPVADTFWGDRAGRLADPFGYQWSMATHIEDISMEEIEKRGKAWLESFEPQA